MPSEHLVSGLISAVRDSGMLPPTETGAASVSTQLLGFMNREQRTYLMRLLLSAREEYQLATADTTLTAALTYPIPSRAVGAALKLVSVVNSQGGETPLHPLPAERRAADLLTGAGGDYYLSGNAVVLLRAQTGTLRFTYFRRFNRLVDETEAAEVASFNSGARTVTLVSVPSDWTGTHSYDFVRGTPHFDTLGADQSASLATLTLTFATALPTDLAVGDYVALAGETPICQAPIELHDVLVQRALVKYLEARGDSKVKVAKEMLDELRDNALALISPRVQGSPKPILNYNAPGWTRGAVGRWWRGLGQ